MQPLLDLSTALHLASSDQVGTKALRRDYWDGQLSQEYLLAVRSLDRNAARHSAMNKHRSWEEVLNRLADWQALVRLYSLLRAA